MDKPGYTKGPWKATRSNPADVSTQGQGDVVERLRAAAREIRNDGTASQVGLSEQECEDIADEITRLRALLSSSRGEQGWRTIDETTPRDQPIRVWTWGREWIAKWDDDKYSTRPRPYWAMDGMQISTSREHQPEFWMPCAAAPGSIPTSLAGQVPDGYVLVPKEPTDGMIEAGHEVMETAISVFASDVYAAMLSAAPQPTAGGDAAPLEPLEWLNKALSRLEGVNEIDVPAAVAAAMTEAYAFVYATRNALSAERARVIDEASTWILGLEAAIRECIDFIESDMAEMAVYETERVLEDPTILERRPSFLPPVRPALRALGQQDTGEQ
jgi:hypothetical protein